MEKRNFFILTSINFFNQYLGLLHLYSVMFLFITLFLLGHIIDIVEKITDKFNRHNRLIANSYTDWSTSIENLSIRNITDVISLISVCKAHNMRLFLVTCWNIILSARKKAASTYPWCDLEGNIMGILVWGIPHIGCPVKIQCGKNRFSRQKNSFIHKNTSSEETGTLPFKIYCI